MHFDRSHLTQPGFRTRRAQNWVSLGLLYAAYYMCRYNITIANPILRETFGWSKEQLGMILTAGFWVYAASVFLNGPIADRIGGRKAILFGGTFVILFTLLFGLAPGFFGVPNELRQLGTQYEPLKAQVWNQPTVIMKRGAIYKGNASEHVGAEDSLALLASGVKSAEIKDYFRVPTTVLKATPLNSFERIQEFHKLLPKDLQSADPARVAMLEAFGKSATFLLSIFIALWIFNCYFQSFGALSIVKVNAAWFHVRERGVFGGIFGIMIQAGRLGIMTLGGIIVTMMAWEYVFFIPAIVLLVILIVGKFAIADAPDRAGYAYLDPGDGSDQEKDVKVDYKYIAKKVFTSRVMLVIALAEFCTGFVRHGIDQWFPSFMREVHHVAFTSAAFMLTAVGMPIGAILGGLLAGTMSDKVFGSRRPPVAALFFFGQALALLGLHFSQSWGPIASIWMFMLVSMCIQGTHSLLSGVASMDFGGKKAAASAAGFFDGMQYLAGGIVGFGLGWFLDTFGWANWTWGIIGFSLLGGILMLTLWNARPAGQLSLDFAKKKAAVVEE
ncbi:MAG TPA: MFS transporter [bacterium]|jgi:OPA family glycerol-3-phosphate transporter-like MFS transporter